MYDLLDLTKTVTHFQKLERVEIGGSKGHALTAYVETTYKDFNKELNRWVSCGYDVLDVSQKQFSSDFALFRSRVKELEQRLGGILNMGFDDCGAHARTRAHSAAHAHSLAGIDHAAPARAHSHAHAHARVDARYHANLHEALAPSRASTHAQACPCAPRAVFESPLAWAELPAGALRDTWPSATTRA
eukprot:6184877-Pleurochrysis_carterae.AAC.1